MQLPGTKQEISKSLSECRIHFILHNYSRSQPFNNVTHDHDQFMNAAIAKAPSYIPAKMKRLSE